MELASLFSVVSVASDDCYYQPPHSTQVNKVHSTFLEEEGKEKKQKIVKEQERIESNRLQVRSVATIHVQTLGEGTKVATIHVQTLGGVQSSNGLVLLLLHKDTKVGHKG